MSTDHMRASDAISKLIDAANALGDDRTYINGLLDALNVALDAEAS